MFSFFFYSEELKSLREQTFLMRIHSFENSVFVQKKKIQKQAFDEYISSSL